MRVAERASERPTALFHDGQQWKELRPFGRKGKKKKERSRVISAARARADRHRRLGGEGDFPFTPLKKKGDYNTLTEAAWNGKSRGGRRPNPSKRKEEQ